MTSQQGLVRSLGQVQAVALNMSNMVGAGPFITIPLIIAAMGGPQCMLGWVLGAVLALSDGLVWSELSAAMPGTGGTYVYLREAFRGTMLGGVLPFLFIWQFILSAPLEIASGYIGFAQYAGYFLPGMTTTTARLISTAVGLIVIALLYRRIASVGKLTVVLWAGMLLTVLVVIVSGLTHFNAALVLDFPPGAFTFSVGFVSGLGSAMLIAMYDFSGYFDICYVAGEVKNPAKVIPRAILWSVVAVALMYALVNLSLMAVIPWREAMKSTFIVTEFMQRLYGPKAAAAVTVLVMWTAVASVFALLLGYSRIAWAAAAEGDFFRVFARLHPTGQFPHVALLVLGGLSILCSFVPLGDVISALLTSRILIQFVGQIAALHVLRQRKGMEFPFRMWFYPVPSLIALTGWLYIFATSGWGFAGLGVATVVAGVAAYHVWVRTRGSAAGG
ncbi:MAG: amino acid permease [Gemmatimonadaceae bacterium]|nr:amino acid permease [Gemmatimonadaceae bacterium]